MYLKKELYELIRTDESIFDFIQESTLDGLWYWDLENPENEWMSPKFWTVLGYIPEEMQHTSSSWQNIINQDDLKLASDNLTKHCENPDYPYDQIVRYKHKNGSTVWIRCRGLAIRDKNGKPTRMLGAHVDITNVKRSEQELIEAKEKTEKSETRYRTLFENMNTGFVLFEVVENEQGIPVDLIIVAANQGFERTTGLNLKDTVGEYLTKVLPGIEKDEADWIGTFSKVALTGEVTQYEQGSELLGYYYSISAFPAGPNQCAVTFLDITQRKKVEEFDRKSAERTRMQRNLIAQLTFEESIFKSSIDDALKILTTKLATILQVDRVSVWLLSEDNTKLERQILFDAASGLHSQIDVLNTADIPSYFKMLRKDSQVGAKDAQNDPYTKELTNNYLIPLEISSLLDSAIQQDGRLIGVLSAEHRGPIRKWHTDEKSFLSAISNMIAQLFANAERKQAEEKLRESESRYRKLFEDGATGMVMVGENFKFLKVNRTFCQMLGYQEEELQLLTFVDITHPDDKAKDVPHVKKMIAGEIDVYRTEKRFLTKNGRICWVQLTLSPFYDSTGQFLYNIGIVLNITERKNAENKLVESEERLRIATEQADIAVWEYDFISNSMSRSKTHDRLYGLEWQSKWDINTFLNATHPEDREYSNKNIMNSVVPGGPDHYSFEFRVIFPDEEIRWLFVHGRVIERDKTGQGITVRGILSDITEQKKIELALRESEERFSTIFEKSAFVGAFTSLTDGVLIAVNEAFLKVFGFEREEVLGKTTLALGINPDAEGRARILEELKTNGSVRNLELGLHTKWGEERLFALNVDVIEIGDQNYLLNTMQDHTERKKAELDLMRMSRLLKNSQEIAHLGSFEFVVADQNTIWSEEEYRIYGLDPTGPSPDYDLMLEKCIHPDDAKLLHDSFMTAMQKQEIYELEHRIIRPDGSIRWVYDKAYPYFDEHGNLLGYVGATLDITERKHLQKDLEILNAELELKVKERTAQLEVSNKELEAFSYSVSHDLRAPLRHINGYVDLLNQRYSSNLPEKAIHYLETISGASSQMGALIDNLLQYSRTGRKELNKSELDLNALLKEVLEELRSMRKGRKITWDIKKLPTVFGDPTLFKVVWTNLLGNAIKYTQNKQTAKISVSCREDEENFVFSVCDNGVGFDMKYAQKLFGVFQRLHSQADFEGTGIGLANVQRIVHKHSGKVWATAKPGKGANFFFSLPKYLEEKIS